MPPVRLSALLVAAFATLACSVAAAQTVVDKARRDEIVRIPNEDPDMAAAMSAARAGLPDFLALARAPRPDMSNFAVKVAVREGDAAEYFWITPFESKDGRFAGRINNTPRSVKTVKLGEPFTFAQGEIVDWMYLERGKMRGNYTACAILKRSPPSEAEDFKKRFGLDCKS